ncbi:MAG: S9 family peptidase [Chloroflexi bacterium]|nr:MAG: S9 family peptidase [Chloroflexota bacterium]
MSARPAAGPQTAPFGSWRSPISSDLIVAGSIGFGLVQLDGDDTYWVEQRPSEGGRNVIVRRTADGRTGDITPAGFNARTRVHEYGGGAYAVSEGVVWFSNYADQRLYRQDPGAAPRPISPDGDLRYADAVVDRPRGRLVCVREDHSRGGEAVNTIVSLDLDGKRQPAVLVSGNDFYSSPRLSPNGSHLAWVTWNHPNMPWDGCELWVAELTDDGTIRAPRKVAGGERESVAQPEWSPQGVLYFMSDRSNWWNPYRWRAQGVEPVFEVQSEMAGPQWEFGQSYYGFESEQQIVCRVADNMVSRLARLDLDSKELTTIATPYTVIMPMVKVGAQRAVFVAGSATEPLALVQVARSTGRVEVLRRSFELSLDRSYLSVPQPIEFPTERGRTAHAFYYPPQNPGYQAPAGERPPLIVHVHGGPTGAVSDALDLQIQYFTSRGLAAVDVNYGGSSGYGREYRERLNGQWGVVDVEDCVNAAQYLTDRELADPKRLAITGGSAGGYTVLRALTTTEFFTAGASHYGISELEVFHGDTHKFESRYDVGLIGPWPEARQTYHDRSPLYSVDRITAPVILFQGLEDRIVPPKQAEIIVEALRRKRLPVAYIAFEGEQHGFRIAANIKRALEGELFFYSKVFGFELADPVQPVAIENLEAAATR